MNAIRPANVELAVPRIQRNFTGQKLDAFNAGYKAGVEQVLEAWARGDTPEEALRCAEAVRSCQMSRSEKGLPKAPIKALMKGKKSARRRTTMATNKERAQKQAADVIKKQRDESAKVRKKVTTKKVHRLNRENKVTTKKGGKK